MRWAAVVTISLVLIIFGVAMVQHAPGREVTLRWNYDYAHDPPCAPILSRKCVIGFHVFVGRGGERHQEVFISNVRDLRPSASTAMQTTMRVRSYGNLQFCVVAIGRDEQGIGVESLPLCTKRIVLPFAIGKQ